MKAFIVALAAVTVISIGAYYGMNHFGQSSADAYATGNVRLN